MKHAVLALLLLPAPAFADAPFIDTAYAEQSGDTWRFTVTLSHPDTGWDHYADGWRIVDEDGQVLGVRELLHPHVDEQPFTRSLGGVSLPEGTTHVGIQARCNQDGWAAPIFLIELE